MLPSILNSCRCLGLSIGPFRNRLHAPRAARPLGGSDVREATKIVRPECDSSHSRDFNAPVSASTGISSWRHICVTRRSQRPQRPQLERRRCSTNRMSKIRDLRCIQVAGCSLLRCAGTCSLLTDRSTRSSPIGSAATQFAFSKNLSESLLLPQLCLVLKYKQRI